MTMRQLGQRVSRWFGVGLKVAGIGLILVGCYAAYQLHGVWPL